MTDRYIAKLNIEHFHKRLAEEQDPREVQILEKLLAEEELKFAQLDESAKAKQQL